MDWPPCGTFSWTIEQEREEAMSTSRQPQPVDKKMRLKTGQTLLLRRAQPTDAAELKQLSNTFSAQTIYNIMFKSLHTFSPTVLERYTVSDDPSRVTIVAQFEKDLERVSALPSPIVGVAHYWLAEDDTANMTIAVGDPWQGQGVGKALLEHLLQVARQAGIRRMRTFYGNDNRGMRVLLEHSGLEPREVPGREGAWEFRLAGWDPSNLST
jgi:GNAT superfamily N-acetyltransferase